MNKVEVFKMTEYADDREREISFHEYGNPNMGLGIPSSEQAISRTMDISRYPIRSICSERAISAMAPKDHIDREKHHWGMKGFSFYRRDPYAVFMRKEKKFVIADEDINSAFNDVENNNRNTDFTVKSLHLLYIDQTRDINKLQYELKSKNEVLGNCKYENKQLENEVKFLKSRNLFQRIFQWKKFL